MGNIPKVGNKIVKLTSRIKNSIKQIFISKMYFEDIGYTYLGPVDGNDIEAVEEILEQSKKCKGPVLVHVVTKKGKGYKLAEKNPSKFHGTAPFDKKTGEVLKAKSKDYSKVFGEKLVEIAKNDNRIVAITAAMADGTGLSEFKKKYPKRFFDVGIAEQHAVTFSAGFTRAGIVPVFAVYSTFLQRAYDQINHDIARMNLPCLIGVDRCGLVGADGETHHGVFDISFLSAIPHIVYMTPKDTQEARRMVNTAMKNFDMPYIMRFPRGNVFDCDVATDEFIEIGTWEKIIDDQTHHLTIITYDAKVNTVKELIEKNHLPINLVNARFIKPMDEKMLNEFYDNHQDLIIYETDLMIGSLGSMIAKYYSQNHMNISIDYLGIDDRYTPQGDVETLLKYENMSLDDLFNVIKEKCHEEGKS